MVEINHDLATGEQSFKLEINLFMTIGENMNMTADDAGSVVLHSNIFIVSQIILRCQCKMF